MQHSKTIAMARGILAEGRLADAARMIEPLLESIPDADSAEEVDPGQLTLRCLLARIALLRRGDHRRAFELLQAFDRSERRARLERGLRAETALWLGWARVWQDDELYDDARALNLLDAAEQEFREMLNPSGRCWALLGQAQAYFTIDEYRLMLQALGEARLLLEKLDDVYATMWLHNLSLVGARFEGRYNAAYRHASELERLAETSGDELAAGRALAHRAVLGYETGKDPADTAEAAGRAEELLTRAATRAGYALIDAWHARIGSLVRLGEWSEAERAADKRLRQADGNATAQAFLALHRARLAVRRGDGEAARAVLEKASDGVHRRQLLLRSDLARELGECALASNDPMEADRHASVAARHARDAGDAGRQLAALLLQVSVAAASGDEERAREKIRAAERHTDYFSLLPFAAERFFLHGLLAELRDRGDEARASFAQALSAYSLTGDVYASACAQMKIARLAGRGASGEARALAAAALETFESLGAHPDVKQARAVLDQESAADDTPVEHKEAVIGSVLARSAYSVELVAESWLQAAEELAPGRWLVVYRFDGPEDWLLVHRHGCVPGDLSFPDPSIERYCGDGVDWMRLRGFPAPAFFFGMECGGDDDPACKAIERKLLPWIPVVGLALDHALLRADRLGESAPDRWGRAPEFNLDGFIYTSPGMQRVAHQIHRVSSGHAPVLIVGEPGTGKSVVARAIHESGDRREAPFVPFACSGISAENVEAALFGDGEGGDRARGALAAAHHGTLYLNDIAELPLDAQPRLLRFIEDGYIDGSGGNSWPLDVRIVASTGRDLRALVRDGAFLEGLFYRLNVVPISVPPLRDRREEIPLLVHHFLKDLTHGRPGNASVTSRALDALIKYDWPGNVRQLRNEIERLLVFAATEPVSTIDVEDLAESIRAASSERSVSMEADGTLDGVALNGRGLDEILANAERSVIEQILVRHDGQVSSTAEALGLSRQGLYKKMKRLGIDASSIAQR